MLAVFGFLLHAGLKSLKAQHSGLANLALLPLIFMVMSVYTLFVSVGVDFFSLFLWILTTAIGIGVGWWQMQRTDISVIKEGGNKLLSIPKRKSTLWISLALFSSQFFLGIDLSTEGTMIQQTPLQIILLCFSGALTGLFVGRFAAYFKAYYA
jgi:hypothetical protein